MGEIGDKCGWGGKIEVNVYCCLSFINGSWMRLGNFIREIFCFGMKVCWVGDFLWRLLIEEWEIILWNVGI